MGQRCIFMFRRASIVWILIVTVFTEGKVCPGFCVPQDLCTKDNGKILGYCVDQRVCCDVSQKLNRSMCGKSTSWDNKMVQFLSPDYPRFSSGSLICPFEIKLDKNTVGVKLEFDQFELDQRIFEGVIKCDGDMFLIKGFSNWMTDARCGTLNSYSVLLEIEKNDYPEKKIIILLILSSRRYRWNIRIHQILTQKLRKSELCLQNRMNGWEKSEHFLKQLNVTKNPFVLPSLTPVTLSKESWKWEASIFLKVDSTELKLQEATNEYNFISCSQNKSDIFIRLCNAAIVDDRHVITTASCFLSQPFVQRLKIVFDQSQSDGVCSDLSDVLKGVDVESVTVHFNFLSSMQANDIAILRTKTTISFGDSVQPLKLVEEYPQLFQKIFFSSSLTNTNKVKTNINAIVPENIHHCSLALASKLQLTRRSLKELQESNKYDGLLQNWICFDVYSPESTTTMTSENDQYNSKFRVPKGGSPLVSSTLTGSDLRLMGIFNYAIHQHVHTSEHQQHFLHENWSRQQNSLNSTRSSTTPYCPKNLIYFTNFAFYRKWILMAIS